MEEKALWKEDPSHWVEVRSKRKILERHFRKVPDTSEAGLPGVVDSACICSVRASSGLELTS